MMTPEQTEAISRHVPIAVTLILNPTAITGHFA